MGDKLKHQRALDAVDTGSDGGLAGVLATEQCDWIEISDGKNGTQRVPVPETVHKALDIFDQLFPEALSDEEARLLDALRPRELF